MPRVSWEEQSQNAGNIRGLLPLAQNFPQENFDRNKPYAQSDLASYKTTLAPNDEAKFQAWAVQNKVPVDDSPTSDYDMRGFYHGLMTNDLHAQTGINANDGLIHFSDYYKTPYHKSFSNESRYALANAPKWNEQDQLVDASGKVLVDERRPERGPYREQIAPDSGIAPNPGEVMGAALRQENLAVSMYHRFQEPTIAAAVPGYNSIKDIAGYENYAERFYLSDSPMQTTLIKRRIDQELKDKDVIARAGGWGFAASIAAGLIDPVTLASMAIPVAAPVAWGSRAARIGMGVAAQATLDAGEEIALHANQETRTMGESILRIGAGALLTGAFGAIATRVPKAEFERMVTKANAELNAEPPASSTAGAAAVGYNTTLEDEGIARGGGFIGATIGKVSPLVRVLQSPIKSSRQLVQRIVDVPFKLGKNMKGIATPESLEAVIRLRKGQMHLDLVNKWDDALREFSEAGGELNHGQFGREVANAMSDGDQHQIPQVMAVASHIRQQFNADRKALQEAGVLPEEMDDVIGAASYFPRVYDHGAIAANRADFEGRLTKWFTDNPKYDKKLVEDLTKKHDETLKLENTAAKERDKAVKASQDAIEAAVPAKQAHAASLQAVSTTRDISRKAKGSVEDAALKINRRQTALDRAENFRQKRIEQALAEDTPVAKQRVAQAEVKLQRAKAEHEAAIAEHQAARETHAKAKDQHVEARAASKEAAMEHRAARAERDKAVKIAEKSRSEFNDIVGSRKKLIEDLTEASTPRLREHAEVQQAVQDTVEKIMGTVRGNADTGRLGNPSPSKARTLDVPDHVLAPYLVKDLDHVMSGYFRSMTPQIEMRKMLHGGTFEQELNKIKDEYAVKQQALTDGTVNKSAGEIKKINEAKEVLRKHQAKDFRNLQAMIDRTMGNIGQRGDDGRMFIRANRLIRAYNYTRLLGSQTLSSMSDYGHVMMRYGATRTLAMTGKLLINMAANKIARNDAHGFATALEWVLDTRSNKIADIGDGVPGSKIDRFAQNATQTFSRATGMATWNSTLKTLSSILEQDAIFRAMTNYSKLNAFKKAKFAEAGIGESEMQRVSQQWAKHGEETEGLNRPRTELWDDKEAAQILETAIGKNADIVVTTRGHGDLPLFMDKEVWKTLTQFKSFGIAGVNRLMIPAAQGLAHGDVATANGMLMALALGGMTYVAKEKAAGREPDLSVGRITSEALNWSGILGFLPDLYDPVAGLAHAPRLSRYQDRAPISTLLGPTFGTASELYTGVAGITAPAASAAYDMLGIEAPEDLSGYKGLSQKDIHAFRKLLPWQNHFAFRRAINAMEGEVGEALGARNAKQMSFVDRLKYEEPLSNRK